MLHKNLRLSLLAICLISSCKNNNTNSASSSASQNADESKSQLKFFKDAVFIYPNLSESQNILSANDGF